MRSKLAAAMFSGLLCSLVASIPAGRAADTPKKVTYTDHVAPSSAAVAARATTRTSRRAD